MLMLLCHHVVLDLQGSYSRHQGARWAYRWCLCDLRGPGWELHHQGARWAGRQGSSSSV